MLHIVDKTNCYVQHLMALSARFQVSTTEDIKNQLGAVLVPKGNHLDEDLAQKVCSHKLQKPLESCVKLNANIDGKALKEYLDESLSENETLMRLQQDEKINALLESACEFYQQYPQLVQKITVLKIQMPTLFNQGILCAYLSLLMAVKMKLSKDECHWAFLAGLVHNIGILSLDKTILANKGEYTSAQWRTLQSHPIMAEQVLSRVPGLPKCIAQAVLEHHECSDGSGYPYNKLAGDLAIMGQIVGMSDTCLAIYQREIAHKKTGLNALIPLLKLNAHLYSTSVFSAIMSLIKAPEWSDVCIYKEHQISALMKRLHVQQKKIQHDYQVIYSVLTCITPYIPNNKKTAMLNSVSKRVQYFFKQSTILQDNHKKWLKSGCNTPNKSDLLPVEEFETIYGEVNWQLKQLIKLLCWLWDKDHFKHPKVKKMVKIGLNKITQNSSQVV